MALIMTSGPAYEPITLAEAKLHLRVDTTAEDGLISSLILTSRLHVETALDLALITQSWSYFLDAWPGDPIINLPLRPVQSINAVRLYADDGTYETIAPSRYLLDGGGTPARLVRRDASTFPRPNRIANGIEIAFTAGYGHVAADVPATVRHAILLLVAHWYEHREIIDAEPTTIRIPSLVSSLLMPFRMARL
jgi:uncharacterized phiE125 gp8 family phage protein